jgi:hypothetical protein
MGIVTEEVSGEVRNQRDHSYHVCVRHNNGLLKAS